MAISSDNDSLDYHSPSSEVYWDQESFRSHLLKETEVKKSSVAVHESFKRTFVPHATFPDGISWQSSTLVGGPGSGKSALARAIAGFLIDESKDGWLHGTDFNPPLIIWSNSLLKALQVATDQLEQDTNYLLFVIDDAIRYGSSKRVMTRRSVSMTMDYAEIRHVVEEQCGMRVGGTLSTFWMTQRWYELAPFFRSSHWLIFKGIDNDRREHKAIKNQVGEKGYNFLLDLMRYILEFKEYQMLENVLMEPVWKSIYGTRIEYDYQDIPTIDDLGGFHSANVGQQQDSITQAVYDYAVKHHKDLLHDPKLMLPVLRSVGREGYDDLELYANVDYCIQDALRRVWEEGYFRKEKRRIRVAFCKLCNQFWFPRVKKPKNCAKCRSRRTDNVFVWDPDDDENPM